MNNHVKKYKLKIFILIFLFSLPLIVKAEEKILRIPLHTSLISFNPALEQDFSSLWVSRQVNCQLLRSNSGEVKLEAAKSISFLSPTIIDIKLNRQYTFNNGNPITADDVIASLVYLKKNRVILRNALDWIKDIRKVNNGEIQIILKKNYPQFLHVFSAPNYSIFPQNFIKKVENNPKYWNEPITCGAYTVSENNKNTLTILPRKNGFPVKFYYIPDGNLSSGQAKNFDIILLGIKNSRDIESNFNKVNIFDPFQVFYIPNIRKSPWNLKSARCALLARLDPSNVVSAYGNLAIPSTDFLPSGTLGYSDIENYSKRIQDIGKNFPLPKINNFSFSYMQSSIEKNIRPKFIDMFLTLFPDVQEKSIIGSEHMADKFAQENTDGMVLVLKSNYLDAYEYLLIFSEKEVNISGYQNDELAAEIEDSQKITQPTLRALEYRKIIKKIQDECLILPLFTIPYENIYVKKNIKASDIGLGPLNEYLLSNVKIYD
ncbi:MAG: hypothetical protein KIT27_10490 [Legionellales bacterium]|nr:hypothetical protein [Legionellales bacterium]